MSPQSTLSCFINYCVPPASAYSGEASMFRCETLGICRRTQGSAACFSHSVADSPDVAFCQAKLPFLSPTTVTSEGMVFPNLSQVRNEFFSSPPPPPQNLSFKCLRKLSLFNRSTTWRRICCYFLKWLVSLNLGKFISSKNTLNWAFILQTVGLPEKHFSIFLGQYLHKTTHFFYAVLEFFLVKYIAAFSTPIRENYLLLPQIQENNILKGVHFPRSRFLSGR